MSKKVKWDVNDPDIRRMIEQVKAEIANEYGILLPPDGYFGHIPSKKLGQIGSQLQKRIPILLAHQQKHDKTSLKKRR